MIARLKALLAGDHDEIAGESDDGRRLAAAALMVEAACADGVLDDIERHRIQDILAREFGLDGAAGSELLAAAETAQNDANHLLRFTRTIKDSFSPEARIGVIEMLWDVAYADGVLHDYEANLLRRVGGLIYVSDRDRGLARRRVLARLGITDPGTGTARGDIEP